MKIKICSEQIDNDAAHYIFVCTEFWKNYATEIEDVLNSLKKRQC